MEQITIDFKNAFDCSKKEKSKGCRSGYVRLVRFMDDKKHTRPQVYEGDLLEAIMDVKAMSRWLGKDPWLGLF